MDARPPRTVSEQWLDKFGVAFYTVFHDVRCIQLPGIPHYDTDPAGLSEALSGLQLGRASLMPYRMNMARYLLRRLFKIGLRIQSHEPYGPAAFLCLSPAHILKGTRHVILAPRTRTALPKFSEELPPDRLSPRPVRPRQ